MESVPLGSDAELKQWNELTSLFDAPAFVRRARGVETALEQLLGQCRDQREPWLLMPRLLLANLGDLAGEWTALRPLVTDAEQVEVFPSLWQLLTPKPRLRLAKTQSQRRLRQVLAELCQQLERFNERWSSYLREVDLSEVNAQRDGYNRYYVLEKACALRSDLLARHGFQPRRLMDLAELQSHFPELPVPKLAR